MKSRLQKKRQNKKKVKLNKTTNQSQRKKKLYESLLHFYNFYHLEDFLSLKSQYFLNLCEVNSLNWNFNTDWLNKDFLKTQPEKNWRFQLSCPLNCKTNYYGELIFFSSQKFSEHKKKFLKKITFFAASALYFIENKEKMENIKRQWGEAFDSFPQAFCITNRHFKIIRTNQSFQKISRIKKTDLFGKNLFEILPVSTTNLLQKDKEGSWLAKREENGQKLCLEISFKPLFLKKEKIHALLFLIKDVTEEIEIEAKLSDQAKDRELGLIKGSIAHELNNPIAGVKALLNVIEKQIPQKKAEIKDNLTEMQKAIDRCHQIITHLLLASQSPKKNLSDFSLEA